MISATWSVLIHVSIADASRTRCDSPDACSIDENVLQVQPADVEVGGEGSILDAGGGLISGRRHRRPLVRPPAWRRIPLNLLYIPVCPPVICPSNLITSLKDITKVMLHSLTHGPLPIQVVTPRSAVKKLGQWDVVSNILGPEDIDDIKHRMMTEIY